jgi:hypothetical protein
MSKIIQYDTKDGRKFDILMDDSVMHPGMHAERHFEIKLRDGKDVIWDYRIKITDPVARNWSLGTGPNPSTEDALEQIGLLKIKASLEGLPRRDNFDMGHHAEPTYEQQKRDFEDELKRAIAS